VWIACRTGILDQDTWTQWTSILDPKTPANRQTGCPDHAMQFLAVGHKIRISFLRNAEQIQKNSYKIQKNLDLIEEIDKKFKGNSE
jgi:hypothetical protein